MGLTNDTYFEIDKFMSVSAYKKFNKCEVNGLVPFDDLNKSIPLMVGSYVDAYVEGTLDDFIAKNDSLFTTKIEPNDGTIELVRAIDEKYITKNDTFNSKLYSELKKLHPECFTVTHSLKADYVMANEICDYIDNDVMIQKFLSGDKQTIMSGEIEGVPFKIKMDAYSKGIAINDLKIMRSVTDSKGNYYDFISQWGYDIQLSCYQEIVFQNTGERLPCFIVAVTKEKPINSVIIKIPQNILDSALGGVRMNIEDIYKVKMGEVEPVGCGKCKTCISNRTQTPIISMNDLLETNL